MTESTAIAFWAALSFTFATGVAFSARIISTDVPLLFSWALALLAYVKLLGRGDVQAALTVRVHAVSGSARAKIEQAGGSVEIVEPVH